MKINSICTKLLEYISFARIDIHCEIQAVPFAQLSQMQPGEPSAAAIWIEATGRKEGCDL